MDRHPWPLITHQHHPAQSIAPFLHPLSRSGGPPGFGPPALRGAQFGGVPEATETDEPLGPVDIGGFGAPAQMLEAQVGLQRLQEERLVRHSGRPETTPALSGCRSQPPGSILPDWGPNNAAADEIRSGRCRRPAVRSAIGPLLGAPQSVRHYCSLHQMMLPAR